MEKIQPKIEQQSIRDPALITPYTHANPQKVYRGDLLHNYIGSMRAVHIRDLADALISKDPQHEMISIILIEQVEATINWHLCRVGYDQRFVTTYTYGLRRPGENALLIAKEINRYGEDYEQYFTKILTRYIPKRTIPLEQQLRYFQGVRIAMASPALLNGLVVIGKYMILDIPTKPETQAIQLIVTSITSFVTMYAHARIRRLRKKQKNNG